MAVTHHAMLCHVVPRSEACRGGWGRWITAPSFPQAPLWRSFPDDLTGCTFLNRLLDCFIIGGQLKEGEFLSPCSEPLRCQSPRTKGGIGLGLSSLDSHLIISNKGVNLFWRRYSQGMSSPAQSMSKAGDKKNVIQPFVMCWKPIYYQEAG